MLEICHKHFLRNIQYLPCHVYQIYTASWTQATNSLMTDTLGWTFVLCNCLRNPLLLSLCSENLFWSRSFVFLTFSHVDAHSTLRETFCARWNNNNNNIIIIKTTTRTELILYRPSILTCFLRAAFRITPVCHVGTPTSIKYMYIFTNLLPF
jgi:hypothetical protein